MGESGFSKCRRKGQREAWLKDAAKGIGQGGLELVKLPRETAAGNRRG